MRLFPQEKFRPTATTRHERLFELIRQDNLKPANDREFLISTRFLTAQTRFRDMACKSLRRPDEVLAAKTRGDDKLF